MNVKIFSSIKRLVKFKCYLKARSPGVMGSNSVEGYVRNHGGGNGFLLKISWLLVGNGFSCQRWCVDVIWNAGVGFSNAWECGVDGFGIGRDGATEWTDRALLWGSNGWTVDGKWGSMSTICIAWSGNRAVYMAHFVCWWISYFGQWGWCVHSCCANRLRRIFDYLVELKKKTGQLFFEKNPFHWQLTCSIALYCWHNWNGLCCNHWTCYKIQIIPFILHSFDCIVSLTNFCNCRSLLPQRCSCR